MATYARLTSDARKQPGELILYLPLVAHHGSLLA
jgi:hypothetical protein